MPRPEPEVAAANARRKSLERLTIPPLTAAESNLMMAVMRVGLEVMFGDSEVELLKAVRAARRKAAAEAREGLAVKLLQAVGDLPQKADHHD